MGYNDHGELLASFFRKRGSQIQARLRIYKGNSYVDMREWVMKDGEWIKTNRGFMIPAIRFREFIRFLNKVATILDIHSKQEV